MSSTYRPRYENQQDLHNERTAIEKFCTPRGLSAYKIPANDYRIDFALIDQTKQVKAFIEYKRRHFSVGKFPDVFLSLKKYKEGLTLAFCANVPFYFLVEFNNNVLMYANLGKLPSDRKITIGGRVDRGDSQDMEPVVHVPMELFLNAYCIG